MSDRRAEGPYHVRIEVFRWKGILSATFRTLSPTISGCFTHYTRTGSVYCDVDSCPSQIHNRERRVWKGYIACEVWTPGADKWFPCVLEVTEACEVVMREFYARGQVWDIKKPPKLKGKNFPMVPKLLDTLDPKQLREAFDYRPVLQTLYNVAEIDLSIKNPMPPPVIMTVTDDAPPVNVRAEKNGNSFIPESEEEKAARREAARRAFGWTPKR